MPPVIKISKQDIVNVSLTLLSKQGIAELNARSIAKALGCSTHPIYRAYKNMDELKLAIKTEIDQIYAEFILEQLDRNDYLFSMSYAYIQFAIQYPNYFNLLFISGIIGKRTINEIVTSDWNLDTIDAMQKQYNLEPKKASDIYRDVRFYTHGIATQIVSDIITLDVTTIRALIRNMINTLVLNN